MFNPFILAPEEAPSQSRTFRFAGGEFTLTLRPPGQVEDCRAVDIGNEITALYLGTKEKPGPGFPPVGGKAVQVGKTLIQNAASLYAMQAEDAPERYTPEQLVAMQISLPRRVWSEVMEFVVSVREAENAVPPTSEPGMGISSGSACEPSNSIPSL